MEVIRKAQQNEDLDRGSPEGRWRCDAAVASELCQPTVSAPNQSTNKTAACPKVLLRASHSLWR